MLATSDKGDTDEQNEGRNSKTHRVHHILCGVHALVANISSPGDSVVTVTQHVLVLLGVYSCIPLG